MSTDNASSPSLDTVADARTQTIDGARRGRFARRAGVVAIAAFVLAGMLGFLGYREGSASATAGPYEVTITHPKVTRGGLPSNWQLELLRTDGGVLPDVIEIRTTASYFADFDENGLDPEPETTWSDGDHVIWTYSPPDGARALTVSFDARLQPNARGWRDAQTTVVVEGAPELSVNYRMWELP